MADGILRDACAGPFCEALPAATASQALGARFARVPDGVHATKKAVKRASPFAGDTALTVAEAKKNDRFAFGENWAEFLSQVDDRRILEAEKSLQWLLGCEHLDGLT